MGKAKKTRKFAEVKRLRNPKDVKPCVGAGGGATWHVFGPPHGPRTASPRAPTRTTPALKMG